MAIIDEQTKQQIAEELKQLVNPVKLIFFEGGNCQYCNEINEILDALTEVSEKIKLEKYKYPSEEAEKYDIDRAPVILVKGKNKGEIRFYGIPAGYEFGSLMHAIQAASDGHTHLSQETIEFLEKLDKPLKLDVFITPTCPYCPRSVTLAHAFAVVSDKVQASMIEAIEFPDWADKYHVSGVPHTVINEGQGEFVGAYPEDMALTEIKKALQN